MNKILSILPDNEDIIKFTCTDSSKSENDANNKIRENIIKNMNFIDDEYIMDPIYGEKWKILKEQFNNAMCLICPCYFKYEIKHMAGRINNYDFLIKFFDSQSSILKEVKLEFKYNASTINETPQFVSPMKPSQYLSSSFEDYYYDKFLIPLFNTFELSVPDKAVYLKTIHSNKPKCMEESQLLYYQGCKQSSKFTQDENACTFYEKANTSSKICISQFIENTDLDIEKLSQYLVESQNEKIYLLYKNDKFYVQYTNSNDYLIESYIKNPEKSRYEALTKSQKKINILLRWKNGNGIAYPAFQIS
jgi:hypothetical protein